MVKVQKYFYVLVLIVLSVRLFAQDPRFDICPLKVGETIPAVSLTDIHGALTNLNDLTSGKKSIVIFYRGAWCGYCTKHLTELNDIYNEVDSLGYQMLGITGDQESKIEISYEKSQDRIPVYSDAKLEAITGFGLAWKLSDETFNMYKSNYSLDLEEWSGEDHHTLAVPAVFIIDDDKVIFQYVNPDHSKRLKPITLLAILKSL